MGSEMVAHGLSVSAFGDSEAWEKRDQTTSWHLKRDRLLGHPHSGVTWDPKGQVRPLGRGGSGGLYTQVPHLSAVYLAGPDLVGTGTGPSGCSAQVIAISSYGVPHPLFVILGGPWLPWIRDQQCFCREPDSSVSQQSASTAQLHRCSNSAAQAAPGRPGGPSASRASFTGTDVNFMKFHMSHMLFFLYFFLFLTSST